MIGFQLHSFCSACLFVQLRLPKIRSWAGVSALLAPVREEALVSVRSRAEGTPVLSAILRISNGSAGAENPPDARGHTDGDGGPFPTHGHTREWSTCGLDHGQNFPRSSPVEYVTLPPFPRSWAPCSGWLASYARASLPSPCTAPLLLFPSLCVWASL